MRKGAGGLWRGIGDRQSQHVRARDTLAREILWLKGAKGELEIEQAA